MARKRRDYQQRKHDKKVRELMHSYRGKGWSVNADLPGENEPEPIGRENRIPDLVARKAGAKRIIEVETKDTLDADSDQHEAFRRSASQQNRTKLIIEEA